MAPRSTDLLPAGVGRVPAWWMECTPHYTLDVDDEEARQMAEDQIAFYYMVLAEADEAGIIGEDGRPKIGPDGKPMQWGGLGSNWNSKGFTTSKHGGRTFRPGQAVIDPSLFNISKSDPNYKAYLTGAKLPPGYFEKMADLCSDNTAAGNPYGILNNSKQTAYGQYGRQAERPQFQPSWFKKKLRKTSQGAAAREGVYDDSPNKYAIPEQRRVLPKENAPDVLQPSTTPTIQPYTSNPEDDSMMTVSTTMTVIGADGIPRRKRLVRKVRKVRMTKSEKAARAASSNLANVPEHHTTSTNELLLQKQRELEMLKQQEEEENRLRQLQEHKERLLAQKKQMELEKQRAALEEQQHLEKQQRLKELERQKQELERQRAAQQAAAEQERQAAAAAAAAEQERQRQAAAAAERQRQQQQQAAAAAERQRQQQQQQQQQQQRQQAAAREQEEQLNKERQLQRLQELQAEQQRLKEAKELEDKMRRLEELRQMKKQQEEAAAAAAAQHQPEDEEYTYEEETLEEETLEEEIIEEYSEEEYEEEEVTLEDEEDNLNDLQAILAAKQAELAKLQGH